MIGTGVLSESDIIYATKWTALGALLGMFIIASSHLARSVDAHPIGKSNYWQEP